MIRLKDRVIVTGEHDNNISIINKKGRVISLGTGYNTTYLIEFYKKIVRGHNGNGVGKQGHCWWVNRKLVKRVGKERPLSTKQKFKELCEYLS